MRVSIRVKEVISKSIIYVEPEINAYQAWRVIATNQIGRLLVMQDNSIIGIITMKDIRRKMQFINMYPSWE